MPSKSYKLDTRPQLVDVSMIVDHLLPSYTESLAITSPVLLAAYPNESGVAPTNLRTQPRSTICFKGLNGSTCSIK